MISTAGKLHYRTYIIPVTHRFLIFGAALSCLIVLFGFISKVEAVGEVTMSVTSSQVNVGQTGKVYIVVNSPGYGSGDGISGIQAFLSYDPSVVEITLSGINPVGGFANWEQLTKEVTADGRIRLAYDTLGNYVTTAGQLNFIEINFRALGAGVSPLNFVVDSRLGPSWVTVFSQSNNALMSTQNGQIVVSSVEVPTPTATVAPQPTSEPGGGLSCGEACDYRDDDCPDECPCRPTQERREGRNIFRCGGVFVVSPTPSIPPANDIQECRMRAQEGRQECKDTNSSAKDTCRQERKDQLE